MPLDLCKHGLGSCSLAHCIAKYRLRRQIKQASNATQRQPSLTLQIANGSCLLNDIPLGTHGARHYCSGSPMGNGIKIFALDPPTLSRRLFVGRDRPREHTTIQHMVCDSEATCGDR